MNKLLLSAATLAMVASSAMAAEKYSFEYDYSTYEEGPVDFMLVSGNLNGGGSTTSVYDQYNVANSWNEKTGCMLISGAATLWNTDNYSLSEKTPFVSGINVVDFGGNVGKVLCLNGNGSGLMNGDEKVPEMSSIARWFHFNWFLSNNNEDLKSKNIRITIKYAVYAANSTEYFDNIYYRGKCWGDNFKTMSGFNSALNSNTESLSNFEEYTFDIPNGIEGPNYLDISIKGNSAFNGKALLIKSIKVTTIDEVEYTEGKSIEFPFDLNFNVPEFDIENSALSSLGDLAETYNAKYYYTIGWAEATEEGIAAATDEGLTYKLLDLDNSDLFTVNNNGVYELNFYSDELKESQAAFASEEEADEEGAVEEGDDEAGNDNGTVEGDDDSNDEVVDNGTDETEVSKKYIPVLFVKVMGGASNDIELGSFHTTVSVETGTTAVKDIAVDADTNAAVEYFNLNGVRVNGDNLGAGLYIRRQGNKVSKVIVK